MKLHLKQNKTSPNIGILLKGVLIPRFLNNHFASCSLINSIFLLPHTVHFDNIFVLFLVFETLGFMFPVFSLHITQKDDIILYLKF